MVSVCLAAPASEFEQNQWDYVLSSFRADAVYVLGPQGVYPAFHGLNAKYVESCECLGNVVVMSPEEGMNVQGEVSLEDFEHPFECTYLFGSDHSHLEAVPQDVIAKVYIPVQHTELYSWIAYAVTMWDRKVKRG